MIFLILQLRQYLINSYDVQSHFTDVAVSSLALCVVLIGIVWLFVVFSW